MTTARKTFTAKPLVLAEPPTIDLEGPHTSDADKTWQESFTCLRVAPAAVLDVIAGSVNVNRAGQVTAIHQAQAIPILRELIVPTDIGRFEQLLADRDRVVDLATLWEAAMWVVGQLTGRPTGGSGT